MKKGEENKALTNEVFEAIGAASMCWQPYPSGVFDSTNAKKIGDDLIDKIENNIPNAIKVVIKALSEDKSEGSYYYSWQANIAMAYIDNERWYKEKTGKTVLDAEDRHIIANNSAKYFLDLLCGQPNN